jgi:hypothetical protein
MSIPLLTSALALTQFVPNIARWLGGSRGEQVASDIVGIAKKICGVDDPLIAIQLLKERPDLLVEFQKVILQWEGEAELQAIQDRQDARARDISLNLSGRGNLRADIMVLCAAGGLISCLVSLAYYSDHLPGEAVGIISTVAGIFGACLKDAYAFEFGSSRESKLRDSTVFAMLERER